VPRSSKQGGLTPKVRTGLLRGNTAKRACRGMEELEARAKDATQQMPRRRRAQDNHTLPRWAKCSSCRHRFELASTSLVYFVDAGRCGAGQSMKDRCWPTVTGYGHHSFGAQRSRADCFIAIADWRCVPLPSSERVPHGGTDSL
jgi:hypothetical protein